MPSVSFIFILCFSSFLSFVLSNNGVHTNVFYVAVQSEEPNNNKKKKKKKFFLFIHALSRASRSSCMFLTRSTRLHLPTHALLRASPDDNLLHAPPHAATSHLFQTRPPDPCSKAADLLDAAMNAPPNSAKRFHAPLSTLLFSWAHLSNLYLRHTGTQPEVPPELHHTESQP
jgi:hypothetical protein